MSGVKDDGVSIAEAGPDVVYRHLAACPRPPPASEALQYSGRGEILRRADWQGAEIVPGFSHNSRSL